MSKSASPENAEKIVVKSRTYKKHYRHKRGTFTEVVLNEACQQASARLMNANVPAKIIKDAVDPYRIFKGGQLWQRLVSYFRLQLREYGFFDFARFHDMDIEKRYTMLRLMSFSTEVRSDSTTGEMVVKLNCHCAPNFRYPQSLTGYRIGVVAIFPDVEQKTAFSAVAYTPTLNLNESAGTKLLKLPMVQNATQVVLCIIAEGIDQQGVTRMPSGRAMRLTGHALVLDVSSTSLP